MRPLVKNGGMKTNKLHLFATITEHLQQSRVMTFMRVIRVKITLVNKRFFNMTLLRARPQRSGYDSVFKPLWLWPLRIIVLFRRSSSIKTSCKSKLMVQRETRRPPHYPPLFMTAKNATFSAEIYTFKFIRMHPYINIFNSIIIKLNCLITTMNFRMQAVTRIIHTGLRNFNFKKIRRALCKKPPGEFYLF